jgi:hypothetical protein
MASSRLFLVNRFERCDHAMSAELYMDSKVLHSPGFAPKAKTAMDLDILSDSMQIEHIPAALVLNIDEAQRVLADRRFAQGQLTLDGQPVETSLGRLSPSPIILDPSMELLYFQVPRSTNVRRLLNVSPALGEIIERMRPKNHNASWNRVRSERLGLSFVDAYVVAASNIGPDVIPSPVPLLNGKNRELLRVAEDIVRWTTDIVKRKTTAFPAVMLPLHSAVFDDAAFVQEVIGLLRRVMPAHRLLIIKVLWYDSMNARQLPRRRLGEFLTEVDLLKQELKDTFLTMLMDARSEGLVTFANWIDVYSEPLDMNVHPYRGKEKEEGEEPDPLARYGRYTHPEDRQDWPFRDILDEIGRNDGRLPHNCPACRDLHGRVVPGALPTSIEWNRVRRQHLFNLRNEEVTQFREAIAEKSVRDIAMRIARGGDLNLFDLLPPEYRP